MGGTGGPFQDRMMSHGDEIVIADPCLTEAYAASSVATLQRISCHAASRSPLRTAARNESSAAPVHPECHESAVSGSEHSSAFSRPVVLQQSLSSSTTSCPCEPSTLRKVLRPVLSQLSINLACFPSPQSRSMEAALSAASPFPIVFTE